MICGKRIKCTISIYSLWVKKSGKTAKHLFLGPKHKGIRNLNVEDRPVSNRKREQTPKLLQENKCSQTVISGYGTHRNKTST